MSEIEKIKRYIKRTHIPEKIWERNGASHKTLWAMIDHSENVGVADALVLAFMYGQAKGYRAAKAEVKRGQVN